MHGLYDAIGTLARMAHANGDRIDENTFPTDDNSSAHGLDVFHQGHYYRIRAAESEPRFNIGSPFVFTSHLRNQYTSGYLEDRVDVEVSTLSSDEQEDLINELLSRDLKTAEEHEDAFQARFEEEISPTKYDVLRLTHGQENRWNGVLVQDRIFPRRDGFDIGTYRACLTELRETKVAVGKLLTETIPPLQDDYVEETVDPKQDKSDGAIAFY